MGNSIWNGFQRIDFVFEGRNAIVIIPQTGINGKWLLKTEYFDAFQSFELEMVRRGWHLAYIENANRWCINSDLELKKRFADYIIKEYNLQEKCVPVGMSCGGMFAVNFAALYPEYIAALYLDAPVLNLLSCPGDLGEGKSGLYDEFLSATGIRLSELICYRDHPIDKMHILLKNNIPVIMVYGKKDDIVPYCENGALLEQYYLENNGIIKVIGKDNCGHHPHGLEDVSILAEFVEMY